MTSNCTRDHSFLRINENLTYKNIQHVLNNLHIMVSKFRYETIILDFSNIDSAFADAMIPLCAIVNKYKYDKKIDFECILPKKQTLEKLFINTNWANLIDENIKESKFTGFTQYPARFIKDDDDLIKSVDEILDCILRATDVESKHDFSTIEWTINEIAENILRHSESSFGGIIHLSKFTKNKKCIEIVLADGGIGIPLSLKKNDRYTNKEDVELVRLAINEGVTNGNGMGNGLFGAYSLSKISGGYFKIYSGYSSLVTNYDNMCTLRAEKTKIPFSGTSICIAIDFTIPGTLEKALKFKNNIYQPISSYLENTYDEESIIFDLDTEVKSFSTRMVAEPFRRKIINIISLQKPYKITFNFPSEKVMSSSFADELFGKLILELGEDYFFKKIQFKNISYNNKIILNRAISQRSIQEK